MPTSAASKAFGPELPVNAECVFGLTFDQLLRIYSGFDEDPESALDHAAAQIGEILSVATASGVAGEGTVRELKDEVEPFDDDLVAYH